MKYHKLLETVKKLNAVQLRVERASENHRNAYGMNVSTKRKAALSDKLVSECWERDKLLDLVHCELVNSGIAEPKPDSEYLPREITQNAGHGHSISLLYHPPKPNRMQ